MEALLWDIIALGPELMTLWGGPYGVAFAVSLEFMSKAPWLPISPFWKAVRGLASAGKFVNTARVVFNAHGWTWTWSKVTAILLGAVIVLIFSLAGL